MSGGLPAVQAAPSPAPAPKTTASAKQPEVKAAPPAASTTATAATTANVTMSGAKPAKANTNTSGGYAPVVVDGGSSTLRVGFASVSAGGPVPKLSIPTLVGTPLMRYGESSAGAGSSGVDLSGELVLGDECVKNRALLECTYPIDGGIVRNWKALTALYDHAFSERLGAGFDTKQHKVLVTAAMYTPKENSAKQLELLFDRYQFEAAKVASQSLMVLFGQGLLTGVAVDCGDTQCQVTPVWEGAVFPLNQKRLNVGGRHVTRQLLKLLAMRGYTLNRSADFETVRAIKERLCYVANDLGAENRLALETTAQTKTYELPDGRAIKVGSERFLAAECVFNPALADMSMGGLHRVVFNAITDCAVDTRKALVRHIVLAGGASMLPGLSTRLEAEVRALYVSQVLRGDKAAARKLRVRVEDSPQRKLAVYAGAAVLADVMRDRTDDFWIARATWLEEGAERLAVRYAV